MQGDIVLLLLILVPLAGGLVTYALSVLLADRPKKAQRAQQIAVTVTVVGVALTTMVIMMLEALGYELTLSINELCGLGVNFGVDGFRALYLFVAAFAWMTASLFFFWYARGEEHGARFHLFTLITLACTIGVLLSADLFTTFVFFEGMSLASYVWVAQEETPAAIRASKTYLAVAVIGGLALLLGIWLLADLVGTVVIADLPVACHVVTSKTQLYIAGGLMLVGFGAKAGCWPLHIWLPKAHPEAPAPASALLSGILTKTGVYGILILSGQMFIRDGQWGRFLVLIGVVTMLAGAIPALMATDIKKVLACSSVSQIGFIVTGAGAMSSLRGESGLAVSGTILHMLNHSSFKLILFLCAGIIVRKVGSRELNKIRGFGRERYWFMALFLIASLGIAGIPGFSGYVSKTMLHESLVACYHLHGDAFYKVAEYLFLLAGGCTLAYMTKLFVVLFLRDPSPEVKALDKKGKDGDLPRIPMVLLSFVAAAIFIGGSLPEITMLPIAAHATSVTHYAAFAEEIELFGAECLEGGLISIGIGVVLFFLAVRPLVSKKLLPLKKTPEYTDRGRYLPDLEDDLYRPVLLYVLPAIGGALMYAVEQVTEWLARGVFFLCKCILALCDKAVDAMMLLVRRTALKPEFEERNRTFGELVSEAIGTVGNGFRRLGNATWRRKHPKKGDCVETVNRVRGELTESVKLVSRSLSYGLMAFCMGLILLMVYILWSIR